MAAYPRGIDVSNNNGVIDWQAVANDGIEFAIAKASEGTSYRDGWFAENWEQMKSLNIAAGAYHFARPSRSGAVAEADYFLDAIALLYGDLAAGDVLALDLEDPNAVGDLSQWALDWVRRVESRAGFRPLIYTSPSYANAHGLANRPELADYGLWLASWWVPTPPPPPLPWSLVAVHQIGVGPPGTMPGIPGAIDLDRFNGSTVEQFKLYGKPAEVAPPERTPEPEPEPEPPLPPYPVYDPSEPSRLQENDWDCSVESCEWMLFAYGRSPDDDWLEQTMIAEGVVSLEAGCLDASGAGLADFLNRHYGEDGYLASNEPSVTFEAVAAEAAEGKHPLALGGRAWYHWSGCRGADGDTLLLANPAPGWQGVYDTLTRAQWDALGPWSMVRLTHPAAEAPPAPEPEPEPAPPTGVIGSGLLEMMAADGTQPAQQDSLWLPPGASPAQIELCFGENGTIYVWLMRVGRGFRYQPSP